MTTRQEEQSPRYAIIVAGGKGLRMQTDLPKQFLPLRGRPVLMHTMECFRGLVDKVVLVLPSEQVHYWAGLCEEQDFDLPHTIALGGTTRFASVRNGLAELPSSGLVAIHDGVRPFASPTLIEACFQMAERRGAAIPAIPLTDSLRIRIGDEVSQAVDRSAYVSVQTPQTFRLETIKRAYEAPFSPTFTDDASVYEASEQGTISLIPGEATNIKLTTPLDLKLAELLLDQDPLP